MEVMILFIAGIVVAGAVAGTLTTEVSRLSAAIDDRGVDVSNQIQTDIEIISDAGSPDQIYNDGGNENITLYVKNTGSSTLPAEADRIELLVDGEFVTDFTVTVVDGSSWSTDNVVELEIDHSLNAGDHRVKVVVNGDEEVFEFRT